MVMDSIATQIGYVLHGAGLVKIGVTGTLADRVKTHQSSSPIPLELLGVYDGGVVAEGQLHRRFSDFRSHGEWFALPADVLAGFMAELRPPTGLDLMGIWRAPRKFMAPSSADDFVLTLD